LPGPTAPTHMEASRVARAPTPGENVDLLLVRLVLRFALHIAELEEHVDSHDRVSSAVVRWEYRVRRKERTGGPRCEPPVRRLPGGTATAQAVGGRPPTASTPKARPAGSAAAGRRRPGTRLACRESPPRRPVLP